MSNTPKRKNPLGAGISKGAFHLIGLTVIAVPVKPLTDNVSNNICRDRHQEHEHVLQVIHPLSRKDSGDEPHSHYIIAFDKKIYQKQKGRFRVPFVFY